MIKTFFANFFFWVTAAVASILLGCSGAGQMAAIELPEVQLLPNQPPVYLANPASDSDLTEEEDLLFEDDLDWDDDEEDIYSVADPLEKFNRAIFVFNDKLYFWVLKPVAKGYRTVMPQPARSGVKNFFTNITAPLRIINNILQGKGSEAEAEWARFLYNTTIGVFGFGNPAQDYPKLNPPDEDLGQTLASYGIGDGFFLMLPFLGPSTLRDGFGELGDTFLKPFSYVKPLEASMGLWAYEEVNDISFRIGDYESLKDAALDPYESFRNAYIQLRQAKIRQ